MFPLPATNNPSQTWMPGAANAGFAVNAKTKNPHGDEVRQLRRLACVPERVRDRRPAAFRPIRATASSSIPALPCSWGTRRAGKTYPFPDQLWPNPKVQNAHLTGLQNIFAGKGTVAQMLGAMDKAYRSK